MEFVTPGLGLLFWQFIVFICVLLILRKFAWNPITSALQEREHSIDTALKAAEQAKLEMAKLKSENEKLLDAARLERDSIIKLARQTADGLIEEAKDKATAESNRIVEAARLAIQQERQAAIQNIKQQVASLSLEIAEIVLRNQLKEDASQRALVNKLVEDANLN